MVPTGRSIAITLEAKRNLMQHTIKINFILKLVSSRASLTSLGGASLALVGNPSSDGVTISFDQLRTPSFPIGLVKTESDFIVRSVETG